MARRRAVLRITAGPNQGDTVSLEVGSCRLVGRHLSENETVMIDRDGNRLLSSEAGDLIVKHLKEKSPVLQVSSRAQFSVNAFERGADVIVADDSISRAHAMIFLDNQGVGVIDLASTNGTLLNGERVGAARVSDGDVITIGKSELSLTVR